jgi:hypothetical protein
MYWALQAVKTSMKYLCIFIGFFIITLAASAQQPDSTIRIMSVDSFAVRKKPANDSLTKKHQPRKATIRSAILPGWGQAYNKKYWKIPIVYAALGTTAVVFDYNIKQYKKIKFAYFTLLNQDTANYPNVAEELQPFIEQNALSALRNGRNEFRRNIDYTVLVFILFWGLNVVDATVDAHLKEFDISNDLSLKIKPNINTLPNTGGITVALTFGKNQNAPKTIKKVF